ncbi:LysR substrate-binding domain-containing protein [Pseudomonas sp. 148P]|uniref:LysR substrate-binding domain-containing protein n=1 Tax=Pseudomonas ulcerans TaxID=3115852 RepID=A0ABU7HRR0_9PSED|nr:MULTISPECIES: LysR substrate-binding domain-containing protein [unclassified Pseudomonas]MEE1922120.1 LysR substrate-binding domain-containing protein [Pseudomonas sp. 147P]MEE1934220.1 LysR substrate-binding domain-containing protein [Pseudomonas sp. 148P]
MTALLQFESVARLKSFTQAAKELGVTQAAVSKQIKVLEENVGAQLFHRLHRRIELTDEGIALFATISESLQKIATVFDQINQEGGRREISLGITASFSQFQLLPRLAALREAMPDLQLRLTTQMFTGDLRTQEADLYVRYGNGHWDDGEAILLFQEEIFPVCSPTWLAHNPIPTTLEELATAGLLDSDSTSEGWLTWQGWFKQLGLSSQKFHYTLRGNLHADVVNAAVHGHGIGLGWGRVVEHLLDSGALVRLEPFSVRPTDAYYAVIPDGRTATPEIRAVIRWLQDRPPLPT